MAQAGSGWDQGAKGPEEFCGGNRVFHLFSACACFMPYLVCYEQGEGAAVVLRAWLVRMIRGRTCRGAHNG